MVAPFDIGGDIFDGFFYLIISRGIADDGHDFEDGDAGADQLSEGAGKASEADFVDENAKDGEFEFVGIPKSPAAFRFEEGFDGENHPRDRSCDVIPVAANEGA